VRLNKPHTIKTKLLRNQTVSLGIEKNGGRLFRRPKLTLSCSAEGKEISNTKQYNSLVTREMLR
jgi:hypothetical protein